MGATPEPEAPRELLQPPTHSIPSPITDRFALRGVYYQPSVDTLLRYDSSAGVPGTEFTAEDTLGLDKELNQGSLEMWLRMAERHRVRVDYFKMTRHGDVVLDQVLRFGDTTFLPGERVVSDMDLRTLGITYTYSIFRHETFEIGLGLGLQLLQLEGSAEVAGAVRRRGIRRRRSHGDDGAGWHLALHAALFGQCARPVPAGKYRMTSTACMASITSTCSTAGARTWPFGLGYSQTRMKVDSTDPEFRRVV